MGSHNASGSARSRAGKRVAPLLWLGCAVAAILLVLGVNGTLSDWTKAVINNNANNVAAASAVILQETGPDGTAGHTSQTCYSSANPTNSSTCSTINKYGGVTAPLTPGTSQTTSVTFTDVGAAAAATFALTPGTCTSTPTVVTGAPAANNLCTTGNELTIAVSCSNGTSYNSAGAWTDLVYTAAAPGSMATKTHTAALASGASWTCQFTAALSATASVLDQGVTVSQPLTWTLNQ